MAKYNTGGTIATIGIVGMAGYLLYKVFSATTTATATGTATGPPPATGVTGFMELMGKYA